VLQGLLPRLFRGRGPVGLLDERRLKAALENLYGETAFADARIPLYLVATDLNTGDSVILSEERLQDAVRASITIPVLLRRVATPTPAAPRGSTAKRGFSRSSPSLSLPRRRSSTRSRPPCSPMPPARTRPTTSLCSPNGEHKDSES
jgi:hypothetical protein